MQYTIIMQGNGGSDRVCDKVQMGLAPEMPALRQRLTKFSLFDFCAILLQ